MVLIFFLHVPFISLIDRFANFPNVPQRSVQSGWILFLLCLKLEVKKMLKNVMFATNKTLR